MANFSNMVRCVFLLTTLFVPIILGSFIEKPGPRYPPTKGEVWPKPQNQVKIGIRMAFEMEQFQFKIVGNNSPLIDEAIERYSFILSLQSGRKHQRKPSNRRMKNERRTRLADDDLVMKVLNINMTGQDEAWPSLQMDESYWLNIDDVTGNLISASPWGILRGLETFSQAIYRGSPLSKDLFINQTLIYDFPRFPHRGLLLDTSRHYTSVTKIIKMLDGMAYNKLNVFHWHIVDDQSFPYVSAKFPTMSQLGSFTPDLIYTPADVQRIIQYARRRGIRVMPEYDTPGHTRSWGVAYPSLLTQCYTDDKPNGDYGPMNPANQDLYPFMKDLLTEIVDVFPDKYVHLGGDEVEFDCWKSNPEINAYMAAMNITTFTGLEEVYIQKIVDMVRDLGAYSLVWQEVFLNGVKLPPGTVVHAWTGNQQILMYNITSKGFPALLSTCWYLDHLSNGGDWQKFYNCDPHNFPGNEEQKKLVMGGEACMWGEVIDDNNVLQRIFPRVSATAEKLWSAAEVNDMEEARFRLEEHYCRMNKRGIPAQPPSGPGFCV
ncbi:beta-hexosaminidase subunit beta-like [Arctopsyche grandis]|uniref:beta-hexosaminidase subunit beta-like n=1 Tax=Arctopsyche grandis TaxID=121162 RepID=UPI00406D9E46